MSSRMWLAIMLAPLAGGAIYAWIGYETIIRHISGPEQPSLVSLGATGSALGLAFELVALIPLYLAVRHWRRLSVITFLLGGIAAWFVLSTCFLVALGNSWSDASATADSMLSVGAAVVLAFWLVGWAKVSRKEHPWASLSWPLRVALTVFVLPLMVGGIALGGILYSWLTGPTSAPLSGLYFVLLVCLVFAGTFSGALLAYGIIIFFLAWLAPNSRLLVEAEVVTPPIAHRILYPALHAVGRFARWLAPRQSKSS